MATSAPCALIPGSNLVALASCKAARPSRIAGFVVMARKMAENVPTRLRSQRLSSGQG